MVGVEGCAKFSYRTFCNVPLWNIFNLSVQQMQLAPVPDVLSPVTHNYSNLSRPPAHAYNILDPAYEHTTSRSLFG